MDNIKHFNLTQLVKMSLLAAFSYILMYIAIPIIPIVPYMKLDISDLPILIGTMLFGPLGGIVITSIKALIYWILTGVSLPSLIGVFSSWIASVVVLLSVHYGLKIKNHFRFIWTIILTSFNLTIVMSILNWLVVTPLYIKLIGLKLSISLPKLVLLGAVPFNFIKGFVISVIFILLFNRLKKWINE